MYSEGHCLFIGFSVNQCTCHHAVYFWNWCYGARSLKFMFVPIDLLQFCTASGAFSWDMPPFHVAAVAIANFTGRHWCFEVGETFSTFHFSESVRQISVFAWAFAKLGLGLGCFECLNQMCLEYAWHGLIMSDRMCSKFPPGHWSQPLMDATGPLGPRWVSKLCFFFRKNMILCFSPFSLEAPRSWPKSWNLMCCRFPARGVHSIDSVVGVSLVVRIIIISCLFEVIWGEVLQSCVVKIGKSWRGAHPKWQAMVAFALASWNDGNVGVWLCTTAFFEVKNCSNPTCSWVFCTAHQQHGALAALITW